MGSRMVRSSTSRTPKSSRARAPAPTTDDPSPDARGHSSVALINNPVARSSSPTPPALKAGRTQEDHPAGT